MADLEDRRLDAVKRLDLLKAEMGAAVLDGRQFDFAPVKAAEEEIASLEAAASTEHGRRIEEGNRQRTEIRAATVARMRALEVDRLDALDKAHASLRAFAKGFDRYLDLGEDIRRESGALGSNLFTEFERKAAAKRASRWIIAVIHHLDRTQMLGDIEWNGTPPPDTPWRENETTPAAYPFRSLENDR